MAASGDDAVAKVAVVTVTHRTHVCFCTLIGETECADEDMCGRPDVPLNLGPVVVPDPKAFEEEVRARFADLVAAGGTRAVKNVHAFAGVGSPTSRDESVRVVATPIRPEDHKGCIAGMTTAEEAQVRVGKWLATL